MTQSLQILIQPACLPWRNLARTAAWMLCLGLAAMIPLDLLFPAQDDSAQIRLIPHAVKLGALAIMSAYILATGLDLARRGFVLGKALAVFVGIMAAYALAADGAILETLILYAKYLFWVAGALAFYLMALHGHLRLAHVVATGLAVIVVASAASLYEGLGESASLSRNGYAYTMLWCIPLVLLSRHKRLSLLPALLAAFAILFTFKRGASVAMLASGLVYLVFAARGSANRGRLIALGLMLLALAAGFAFWQADAMAARWNDMDTIETAGSHRGELYATIVNHYVRGDLLNIVLGYGFNSVLPYMEQIGHAPAYAHSDVLEILHDQGLVGLAAFAAVHAGFVGLLIRMWRIKSRLLPSMAMAYAIFVCMNIYSGCTMYSETALLSLLVGYSAGTINREACNRGAAS